MEKITTITTKMMRMMVMPDMTIIRIRKKMITMRKTRVMMTMKTMAVMLMARMAEIIAMRTKKMAVTTERTSVKSQEWTLMPTMIMRLAESQKWVLYMVALLITHMECTT